VRQPLRGCANNRPASQIVGGRTFSLDMVLESNRRTWLLPPLNESAGAPAETRTPAPSFSLSMFPPTLPLFPVGCKPDAAKRTRHSCLIIASFPRQDKPYNRAPTARVVELDLLLHERPAPGSNLRRRRTGAGPEVRWSAKQASKSKPETGTGPESPVRKWPMCGATPGRKHPMFFTRRWAAGLRPSPAQGPTD